MESFIWKSIVCRFGVPHLIITGNDTVSGKIVLAQSFIKTPQTNGQTETMNKKILIALKKKVVEAKSVWLNKLPGILWALRTSHHTAIGETIVSLVYGAEAVIPAEIGMRSHRTTHFNEDVNREAIRLNIDLINEFREVAEIKNATCA
ncbi:rve domain-containing protein [Gossypium australe]|uniref:Rve domain-containing protein n=1 Tax=Gossypium australe TaxID=47621 RepID=A0A5B6VJK4_9ROSI|nr:rve domain-containing protein [Gossypium australe]